MVHFRGDGGGRACRRRPGSATPFHIETNGGIQKMPGTPKKINVGLVGYQFMGKAHATRTAR
jgi:hypothetical protein